VKGLRKVKALGNGGHEYVYVHDIILEAYLSGQMQNLETIDLEKQQVLILLDILYGCLDSESVYTWIK
jgi:hypothetical protein